ncbi:uncharacterized protein LOC124930066 [Impatiens glandulifera]|uniref:uncharacterized protein LOC124930066 n=1 Tax=Impatiens glandulifera TaxID=253017 RepID=UPI001FB16B1C|nr:uncharacterized protein LOC124930066 [Impatiens glandulifera]
MYFIYFFKEIVGGSKVKKNYFHSQGGLVADGNWQPKERKKERGEREGKVKGQRILKGRRQEGGLPSPLTSDDTKTSAKFSSSLARSLMAASSRAFVISRFAADHSFMLLQPAPPCLPFSHHFLLRPLLPSVSRKRSSVPVNCLVSGVDGGGVSDDFVSTRNSGFDREFSVIANMLMKIEPLDTSLISKGVSDSAKDSMKETISAMLGLLPSDQFSVTVSASNIPFYRLLVSSIMTGYTLWNAEYRISLMRNFDIQSDSWSRSDFAEENHVLEVKSSDETDDDRCADYFEKMDIKSIGALSPEALNYIQNLESELSLSKKELDEKKQENAQIESCMRENNNDLLEYLRSLESDMVTELSQPSSSEVEDIIRKLVQNILRQFNKEASLRNAAETEELHNSITASSRDYLAKLLFWCMLMGHHLRGLENRLHLSCAVGLL